MRLVTVLTLVTALSRRRSLAEREQQTQPQNSLVAVFQVVESTWPNLYIKRACQGWYGCKTPFLQSYIFLWTQEKHLNPAHPWSSATSSQRLQASQAAPGALQPGAAISWVTHGLAESGAERALLCDGLHQVRLQIQNLQCNWLYLISRQRLFNTERSLGFRMWKGLEYSLLSNFSFYAVVLLMMKDKLCPEMLLGAWDIQNIISEPACFLLRVSCSCKHYC